MNKDKFEEGIRLFNDRKFYECHDLFEEIWMNEEGSEAEFFRALIHLAVGCYHMNNGNFRGAKSQLIKSLQKLEMYTPDHLGVQVSPLRESIRDVVLDIERLLQGQLEVNELREKPIINRIAQ